MKAQIVLILALFWGITVWAHPNHPSDSLSVAAAHAYEAQNWAESARLYTETIANGVDDPSTVYNCACSFALSGDSDKAFSYLELALEKGFTNVQHLKRDTDFASLHDDSRWPEFVEKMTKGQFAYLDREGINPELFFMVKEDQQARRDDSLPWDSIAVKDAERLSRVKELVTEEKLNHANDYFNAALICQHGTDSTDYRMAHELSVKAYELDPDYSTAKWLSAASWDRYLQSMGLSQIYGTQYNSDSTGVWTLEPIDTTAVTDQERALLNVPSLEESRSRVAKMNKEAKE